MSKINESTLNLREINSIAYILVFYSLVTCCSLMPALLYSKYWFSWCCCHDQIFTKDHELHRFGYSFHWTHSISLVCCPRRTNRSLVPQAVAGSEHCAWLREAKFPLTLVVSIIQPLSIVGFLCWFSSTRKARRQQVVSCVAEYIDLGCVLLITIEPISKTTCV